METSGANAVLPRKTLHGFVPMHGPGLAVERPWRHHAVLDTTLLRFTDGKLSLDYSRNSHIFLDYPPILIIKAHYKWPLEGNSRDSEELGAVHFPPADSMNSTVEHGGEKDPSK